jgi:hypothetical protein
MICGEQRGYRRREHPPGTKHLDAPSLGGRWLSPVVVASASFAQ